MSGNNTIGTMRRAMCAACAAASLAAGSLAAAGPQQAGTDMTVASLRGGIKQWAPEALAALTGLAGSKPPRHALAAPGAALGTSCLQKEFPVTAGGVGGVGWIVCVTDMGLKGLWVGPVYLKRGPASGWMQVLYEAGLADIFVPYHSGDPRLYDMRYTVALAEVTQEDAGRNGSPISIVKGAPPTVVAEVRQRGVAWLCKQATRAARRGEEFVVWGVSDAGNYDNIIQFSFRDDGSMAFRLGHTGYNNPVRPVEPHAHTALWRVDMDLNGSAGNTAYLLQHVEPVPGDPRRARDDKILYGGGREGAIAWTPVRWTTVLVEDAATNALGNRIGYEFVPLRSGVARHYGSNETWTQADFFVTQYHFNEQGWIHAWQSPEEYVVPQSNDGESVVGQDLVVWMQTSVHHEPHDEDNSAGGGRGVTSVHWGGFTVEPHNLFAANPLGGPAACGP